MAFHSYPHLIPAFLNRLEFGPPLCVTRVSTWTWIDHSASGLLHTTYSPYLDSVSLRLRDFYPLTLQYTVTRRLILQKARHHRIASALTVCKSTVSDSFSLPSRGSFHLSLTVLCAIGSLFVFSLGRWASRIQAGFLVSRLTQVKYYVDLLFSLTGLSPCLAGLPSSVLLTINFITTHGILYFHSYSPTTPIMQL